LRRGLQLRLRAFDHLLELAGAGEYADRLAAGVVDVVNASDWTGAAGRGRAASQDLAGDLRGGVRLVPALVLRPKLNEHGGAVTGLTLGPGEHRLGEVVHAEAVHLSGEIDLRGGVEPQAEEAVGGLAGAVEVAGAFRDAKGRVLPTLHHLRVEGRNRVE